MQSKEPIDWQQSHSPTAPTEVIISHTPRRVKAGPQRRILDKRLWDGLTEEEKRAVVEIERAWRYLTGGLGAKAQRYERLDMGTDHGTEISAAISQAYRRWRLRVSAQARSACIAVVVDNVPMLKLAKAYGKDAYWPRKNLGECLEAWIEIRGWA